jgi:hypothetical protein
MTDHRPSLAASTTGDGGALPGSGSSEPVDKRRRWLVISGIVVAKLAIIAVVVLLPTSLALSLGAAHGLVMVVLPVSGVVGWLVLRHQRRGTDAGGPLEPAEIPSVHRRPRHGRSR